MGDGTRLSSTSRNLETILRFEEHAAA